MHGLGLIISMFVELSQPFHSLQWTDDTSMALCLAESLIECQGFNPDDQASRYWRWYQVSGTLGVPTNRDLNSHAFCVSLTHFTCISRSYA